MPAPWRLAQWELDLWDARDSHSWNFLLGRKCTVAPRWYCWLKIRIIIYLDNPLQTLKEITAFLGQMKNPRHQLSALQCRLECGPGYVANRKPLITCVNGEYAKQGHYLPVHNQYKWQVQSWCRVGSKINSLWVKPRWEVEIGEFTKMFSWYENIWASMFGQVHFQYIFW